MKTFNGIMSIEVEFEFTETHPAMPAQIDSQGQGICPPAPPEWELEGFCLGGVDVTKNRIPHTKLLEAIKEAIERHIGYQYKELTQ